MAESPPHLIRSLWTVGIDNERLTKRSQFFGTESIDEKETCTDPFGK